MPEPQKSAPPTFADVVEAAERVAGAAIRTPLLHSPVLSAELGAQIFIKPECLQRTGSFKFRGACNAISALQPRSGVVACSSGNHAQGIAEAARLAGIKATIVMPEDAPKLKRQRTAASGARIVGYDRLGEDREAIAEAIVADEGGILIHPYDNAYVIAGQGTIGLEIAADLEAAGLGAPILLVPCGGGGLSAGVTLAVTERFSDAAVHIVEPEEFDDYGRSLEEGEPVANTRLGGSVCDALLSPQPGRLGWEINCSRLAGALSVSDEEALAAAGYAFDVLRLVVEPGGAVALAALMTGRLNVRGRTVVVVLSGGNVSDEVLAEGIRLHRRGART